MNHKKTKRWLRAILWALVIWWGIIISNDILTNWIYSVVHYWKFVVYPMFIYWLVLFIIKRFNLTKISDYDTIENTKRSNGISIAGLVLILGGIALMGAYNKEIKIWEKDISVYISNHIEFREWRIPVIRIWELDNVNN